MIPFKLMRNSTITQNDAYHAAARKIGSLKPETIEMHYQLGQYIQKADKLLNRTTVLIASGDLSHRLKEDGPYGYQKEGSEYDSRIMDVMGKGTFGELFRFPEDFCEKAGECGHRSFTVMAGALDKCKVEAHYVRRAGIPDFSQSGRRSWMSL